MDPKPARPQLTPLLDNDALARLERLRLGSARRFTNRHRGEHLSGKGGQSTDFSDYRDYAAGDDVRFVDWNIFSRLNRPYLKLFRQEEEMHLVTLVDASASMAFEGKLERAKQLAAAFSLVGLFNQERVSSYAFHARSGRLESVGPHRGRANLPKFFRFLESIEGAGDLPLDEGIDRLLKVHHGRGVVVLLSDFLTFADLRRSFNSLFSHGLEILALQILSPVELEPELSGDVRMVDCETGQMLDVTAAGDLLTLYHQCLDRRQRELAAMAQQRSGRYLCAGSDEPLHDLLFDRLRRKGWIV